jgi:hypothetical protein
MIKLSEKKFSKFVFFMQMEVLCFGTIASEHKEGLCMLIEIVLPRMIGKYVQFTEISLYYISFFFLFFFA